MGDDILVKVDNVSKRFCRSLKRSLWYGLKDLGSEISGRRHGGGSGLPQSSADVQLRPDEFWAVKDVSFELRRGECLGLIGRNGAGKTTLLRMLNGLIKPDTGRIQMSGRVGALIALGAGFNPILTGRENIHVNASILGLNKSHVKNKVDEIVDFAEIAEFIDSPVQTYSSGMQVRLGFAIASTLNPDILILDEVLAVGDARFRSKCWKRLGEILPNACAILVSHEAYAISRMCDSAALLRQGIIESIGPAPQTLAAYANAETSISPSSVNELATKATQCSLICSSTSVSTAKELEISVDITLKSQSIVDHAMVNIYSQDDNIVAQSLPRCPLRLAAGNNKFRISIGPLHLPSGNYSIGLMLSENGGKTPLLHSRGQIAFAVESHISYGPTYYPPSRFDIR